MMVSEMIRRLPQHAYETISAPRLERYAGNPILVPTNAWWESRWVYNTAAAVYRGRVHLLYRAQGADWISRLGLAVLDEDGVSVAHRSGRPVFEPATDNAWERLGVEDPRVSRIGDVYYLCYTAASLYPALKPRRYKRPSAFSDEGVPWRTRIAIARTRDFRNFRRCGMAFRNWDNKNGALFPRKVRGWYVLLHRLFPDIHLGVSRDLHHWHNYGPLIRVRPGHWDGNRVGVAGPPLPTPYGWLLIYHGVDDNRVYRLGIALLDLDDPRRVIARSDNPILEPEEPYEREGLVPNVVFSCGAVDYRGRVMVYYGAADSVVAVASVPRDRMLTWARDAALGARQDGAR
jgi:predicted GH43/DUF377 family glycosyl hydrolase